MYTFTVKSKLSGIINDRTCVRDVLFLGNICKLSGVQDG